MNRGRPKLSARAKRVLLVISHADRSWTESALLTQYNQTYPPIRIDKPGRLAQVVNVPLKLFQMNEQRLRRILTLLETLELITRVRYFDDERFTTTAKGNQALVKK